MLYFRIHNKITIIFTFIIVCLLATTFLYINKNVQSYIYRRIRADLVEKSALARTFIEQASPKADMDALAGRISRDLGLRVTIINAQGVVQGDSNFDLEGVRALENHLYRPEVQQSLKAPYGESRRFSTSTKHDFLYLARQYHHGTSKGFIRLALPLEDIHLISERVKKILGVSFLLAFAFSIIASYLASLFISHPIERIAQGARRIAAGNFDNRIFISGHDEIGELGKTFNDMAEEIHDRIEDVEIGRSRLEAVFSSMAEGVLVVDEHGGIFLMNESLRVLLNITDDPVGKRPLEVIRNADIQEMIALVQSEEKRSLAREIDFAVPDQCIMQVQAVSVRRDERVSGAVLVFHDITELRRLENIRREFVANVSHELRTPAASIKGYAETLLDGALKDEENAEDFVRIIMADADRLAKLIEDLLDLSSIESGKMIKGFTECSLRSVLDRALESVTSQAKANDVDIRISGLDKDITVKGDDLGLFRMFLNLVENAVKYNRKKGKVDISVKRSGDVAHITIKDTGIGIPPEDLPRIFERFYRVDKARSRQLGGTGLGLSIVKHLVQAHGGRIHVESVPDKGSAFTITLPCA